MFAAQRHHAVVAQQHSRHPRQIGRTVTRVDVKNRPSHANAQCCARRYRAVAQGEVLRDRGAFWNIKRIRADALEQREPHHDPMQAGAFDLANVIRA